MKESLKESIQKGMNEQWIQDIKSTIVHEISDTLASVIHQKVSKEMLSSIEPFKTRLETNEHIVNNCKVQQEETTLSIVVFKNDNQRMLNDTDSKLVLTLIKM